MLMGLIYFRCCNDDSEPLFLDQNPDESTAISEPPFEAHYLVYKLIIGIYDTYLIYSLLVVKSHLLINSTLSSLILQL
jgi:hypothetical protein